MTVLLFDFVYKFLYCGRAFGENYEKLKNTNLTILCTNLHDKNEETPPKLDSDQEPPKTPHDPCRRPSER